MRINEKYQYRLLALKQPSNDAILGLVVGLSTFYSEVYKDLILIPTQSRRMEK